MNSPNQQPANQQPATSKLSKLLKFLPFMLLFLVFGCEKDKILQNTEQNTQKKKYTIKTVFKKDIKANPELFKLVQQQVSNNQNTLERPIKSADGNIVFNPDHAQFMQYGDSHSYTFAVINTPTGNGLENVVFFSQNGGYRIFLAKYDLTEKEIEILAPQEVPGVDSQNPQETILLGEGEDDIEFTELNEAFLPINRNNVAGRSCPRYIYIPYCTQGNHAGGALPDGSDCPAHSVRKIPIPCSDGGGGGNGNGPGGFGQTTPYPPCLGCPQGSFGNFLATLSPTELDWILEEDLFRMQVQFFLQNNNTPESKSFANKVIEAKMNEDFSDLFALGIFTQDPYDVWGSLSQAEKDLIKLHPFKAYEIFKNRPIATNHTYSKFAHNGLNDKSDAFRHAFFQAINARDVGIGIAGDFADAHESDVPLIWALEKQMDLANNEHGLFQGGSYFPNYNDQQMSDLIYQDMLNGELDYLFPINYNDPNFWDNPNTPTPNDGTHGITTSTILIPTNQ